MGRIPSAAAGSGAGDAHFNLLFASHPEPMWVYDLRTLDFLAVNDAAVARYGYTREEFLHMRITAIRPPEDADLVEADARKPRSPLQYSGEWRHQRKDGRLLDVEIISHTLDYAGRAAVLVIAHDITERKRTEEERAALLAREQAALAEAAARARQMEEFLSVAGHELRTPLTSVLGNVQLAAKWVRDLQTEESAWTARLDRITTVLGRMERQGRQLSRLVNDLLDTSRIQAGRLALRLEPCNLTGLIHSVVQEQQQQLPQRTVHLELPAEEVSVVVDGDRIAQVLANYLVNALKYSDADRPVTVGLHIHGEVVKVWVRDEGSGLPEHEQERIWERFYRAAGAGHRDGSSVGLGLGLYISRSIIERHGGQVGVESVPGAGATFWFSLALT